MSSSRTALRELIRDVLAETLAQELADNPNRTPAITVSTYAGLFIAQRKRMQIVSVMDDETRLRLHVLPPMGQMPMTAVRPRDIKERVLALRSEAKLAPRTIRQVYALLHTMFRDAVADEVITANPCVLARGVLPPNVDADPAWRKGAVFTRAEVEALISDRRLPLQRRVLYAMKALAALRHKEAARLRWNQIEQREPLAAILLDVTTKAKRERQVPIHPTLAWVLADWRLRGWREVYGRTPGADDLVIPNLAGNFIHPSNAQHQLLADLERLGWRRRRGHDLRRTFITMCRTNGARDEVLRCITHGPKPDILEVYTSWPFHVLCDAIMRLPLSPSAAVQPDLPFTSESHLPAFQSVSPARIERATNGLKAGGDSLAHDAISSVVVSGRG